MYEEKRVSLVGWESSRADNSRGGRIVRDRREGCGRWREAGEVLRKGDAEEGEP